MTTNRELLTKADWALSDLTSSSGLLNPEQADTFIRKLLVQPVMLGQVRRVVMNAPTRKVNKIGFGSRILMPATSATALAADSSSTNRRSKPTTSQITLTTSEVIAEIRLPYEIIEDNIERGNIGLRTDVGGEAVSGGIKDTIMSLIAERAAVDLEELALKGDKNSGDAFLALQDGWLIGVAGSGSHTVDAAGAPISRRMLTDGMKSLPSQYRRNRGSLGHFLSTENEIDYRETLAQRETAMGDAQLTSTAPVYGAGAPVVGVGQMPASQGFLTNPLNLLFGIQRDIHLETGKDISARQYIIVLTARIALQVEEAEACVKYINIGT
jgi:hypothetical protein